MNGFVNDGWGNDNEERGKESDDKEVCDGDGEFYAVAWDEFGELADERIDGEGKEKRGADYK